MSASWWRRIPDRIFSGLSLRELVVHGLERAAGPQNELGRVPAKHLYPPFENWGTIRTGVWGNEICHELAAATSLTWGRRTDDSRASRGFPPGASGPDRRGLWRRRSEGRHQATAG